MKSDKLSDTTLEKDPNFVNGTVAVFSQKKKNKNNHTKRVYIESYGCQMNFSDSEIVASILSEQGFINTDKISSADLVLINTCSIRDKAEKTVRNRLHHFNSFKEKKEA